MILFAIWMFLLGLSIGSFLNVCIVRLPEGGAVVSPASRCVRCLHPLGWKDNVPLFSYLLLRGKCRYCGDRISLQYPMVELATGGIFLAAVCRFAFEPALMFIGALLPAVLLAISIIDVKHRVVPDKLSLPVLVAGIVLSPFNTILGEKVMDRPVASLSGVVVALALLGLAAAWGALRRRSMLGGGDVKLLAALGAFLGWKGACAALVGAAAMSILFQLPFVFRDASKRNQEVPFAPFLSLGGAFFIYLPYGWFFGI